MSPSPSASKSPVPSISQVVGALPSSPEAIAALPSLSPLAPFALAGGGLLGAALVARGYPHHEPVFTLFFLAADFLPAVRLSPRGVWDVKAGRVLMPSRRR